MTMCSRARLALSKSNRAQGTVRYCINLTFLGRHVSLYLFIATSRIGEYVTTS